MKNVLITGGAGFVGTNLAIFLKQDHPSWTIISLDNLHRRGSELNVPRLRENGIQFTHGDVRIREDIEGVGAFDLLIECSAEPSVLAGYDGSPVYPVQTNLIGTLNCMEACRKQEAEILFLSTSRVYPMQMINDLTYIEEETRLDLDPGQNLPGVSPFGFSEDVPLTGVRSFYGATKLCSEFIIQEYMAAYGIRGVILRCGVLTGPWQMGKVDQGFVVLWLARHLWPGRLAYIGYDGKGKQVRDILHVNDLYALVAVLLDQMEEISGAVFNVGGGRDCTVSLCELTKICQEITGNKIPVDSVMETRKADIPYYVSDCRRVQQRTGWKPRWEVADMVLDIYGWLRDHEALLRPILEEK
jgi:CDP-paratose 2-epimerase